MVQRTCEWAFLPALDDKVESACGAPVDDDSRYCAAHQEEMDYIHTLDEDWKEIEATHRAVCDEPRGRATKTHLSPKP